ncbi:hypothetical protein [Methylobacterium organophilum]|uniref:PXPV repeat-containing protein n=1 Tax=Methylobacterium organophilum TaxID=410 RepID=A0ABQ4TAS4_METOR|nr:hypothetical protein [Methylobacterium organophilum]GJE27157.1 hypothetical protein LKMONMHP_2013 [Methylobacterium organophilum]
MKRLAALSAAALMGVGVLTSSAAEARGGGALAAGIIGGLAAGALLGAVAAEAHPGPAYGAYGRPYDVEAAPVDGPYEDGAPVYERRRVIAYEDGPRFDRYGYGYSHRPHRWHCDREGFYGARGW